MYEELLNENEVHPEQIFPKIHIGKTDVVHPEILDRLINQIVTMSDKEMHDTLIAVANNQYEHSALIAAVYQ